MINRLKYFLVLTAIAVLAISFHGTSYSKPSKGIPCPIVKTLARESYQRGQSALYELSVWQKTELKLTAESQKKLFTAEIADAANLATIYGVFCKD